MNYSLFASQAKFSPYCKLCRKHHKVRNREFLWLLFAMSQFASPKADQRIREMRSETNVSIAILISSGRNEAERTVERFSSTELMIRTIAFEY